MARVLLILLLWLPMWLSGQTQINYAEYFVDRDPGLGNGTSIAFTPAAAVEFDFQVALSQLETGVHVLYVRTQDTDNRWSATTSHLFFIPPLADDAQQLVRAEYFIDSDPGLGNAKPIAIDPVAAAVSIDFLVDVKELIDGFHTLQVRIQDDRGNWSQAGSHVFMVKGDELVDEIVALKYNFVRPGFASEMVTFTLEEPAALVDLDLDIDLSDLPGDQEYELHLYAVSSNGTEGLVRIQKVRVCEGLPVTAKYDYIAVGTEISFIDGSENTMDYHWDFGDGKTSTVSNPIHRYEKGGNYEVTLTASSFCNTETFTMTVSPVELQRIHPIQGGNGGTVMLTIWGAGFSQNTEVKLVRGGREIAGYNQGTAEDGKVLYAVFDLRDAPLGSWDIQVANPGFTGTLSDAFIIEAPVASGVSISITGREVFRPGWINRYSASYTNTGNNDLYMVPITIVYPKGATATVLDRVMKVTADGDNFQFTEEPSPEEDYFQDKAFISLVVSHIPANSSGAIDFDFVADKEGEFDLSVVAGIPLMDTPKLPYGKASPDVGGTGTTTSSGVGRDCYSALAGLTLATFELGASFVPGANCAKAITTAILGRANLLYGAASIQTQGVGTGALLLGNTVHAALLTPIMTVVECTADMVPLVKAFSIANAAVGFGLAVGNLYAVEGPCLSQLFSAAKMKLLSIASYDPNEKVGPATGIEGNHLQGYTPLGYTVFFENLATATAPAQEVVVVDQIDTEAFDLSTLHLTGFGFGNDAAVQLPAGLTEYSTTVDLRPGKNLIVRVDGKLNAESGTLTWRFLSLDPATMELTDDPLEGFLPPNKGTKEGEGYVSFSIMPYGSLATGTTIENNATIYFDGNEPIVTNTFLNTIDKAAPVSKVAALPSTTAEPTFTVSWSGTDEGAGIHSYDVYVARNDEAFMLWQYGISATEAAFTGESGATYRFYSIARDHAGNVEQSKNAGETQVKIEARRQQTIVFEPLATRTYGDPDVTAVATASSKLPVVFSSSDETIVRVTNEGTIQLLKPGTVTITANQPGDADYWPAQSVSQQLIIRKAPLTIRAVSSSRAYGEANPVFEAAYEGFVLGDGMEKLSALLKFSINASTASTVGEYPIRVAEASSDYYEITYMDGILTVTKASQTISFVPIPVLQRRGDSYQLEASSSSGLPVTFSMPEMLHATLAGNLLTPLRVGTGQITAAQSGDENYLPAADVVQSFRITDEQDAVVRIHPAVSPDGDGMNDFLVIEGIADYPDNGVAIYDRNGLKIFETNGYDNGSRVFRGIGQKGKLVPQGTYFYVVEFKRNGKNERLTGYFVIRY